MRDVILACAAAILSGTGLLGTGLLGTGMPLVQPAFAQQADMPDAAITRIAEAMQIPVLLGVMQQEGIAYGEDLALDLLGGADDRWSAIVAQIYDRDSMEAGFLNRLSTELAPFPDDLAAIEAFFASEQGQRIVMLEIEARRAMLDEAVEEAAKVLVQDMVIDKDPRLEMLQDFVDAGDLLEQNVVGALNANFAFLVGMADAGGPAAKLTEAEMLNDVWGREDEVRASTREYLFSYLALAYQPLDDADLAAYTAFWETDAGKRAGVALFAAYDQVFGGISRELGRAAALQMQGDDI